MRRLSSWAALAVLAPVLACAPLHRVAAESSATLDSRARAAQVKELFRQAWSGYTAYAWGHDSLRPLTHGAHDWYSGGTLLMTPVDALDTMLIMGLDDEAKQALELIKTKLSFDQDSKVSVFETTIRILGGLLSSYQRTHDAVLLALADDLGRRLLPAFDSPTRMPYGVINLRTGAVSRARSNPAEIGSLLLEFGTLSRLTGKPEYYTRAKTALVELFKRASKRGLVGSAIDVETGRWTDPDSHVGGAIDSYYEYLYKGWLLFGDADLKAMWLKSITALNRDVADSEGGSLWYGHVDMRTGRRQATHYGALDAFFAGLLALSGDLPRARALQESNFRMWSHFGIEPEQFDYRTWQVLDPIYRLRPEIIESAFYLRYFTGDDRYLEMGEVFVDSLVSHCQTKDGTFAELKDVTRSTPEKIDSMESYFFAETLKYAYLLFAPKGTLDPTQDILNTEAHPLRRTW